MVDASIARQEKEKQDLEQVKQIAQAMEETDIKQRQMRQQKEEQNLQKRLQNQQIMEERCQHTKDRKKDIEAKRKTEI